MSSYKVPQDVEADDKLIGPFSFRQFIYLIIVAIAIAIAWALYRILLPLAILPLPIILFFGALALPLRKDQPMEIYLAAVVNYVLKPKKRLWQPDGIDSPVEITVPKVIEKQLAKDISPTDAGNRISFISQIMDSEGWSVRGVGVQPPSISMSDDIYAEASSKVDMFDTNNYRSQSIDSLVNKQAADHRKQLMEEFQRRASAPLPSTILAQIGEPAPAVNNYPDQINQTVVQPVDSYYQYQNTSAHPISPDIIVTGNENDLSSETSTREPSRVNQGGLEDEVIVSLR